MAYRTEIHFITKDHFLFKYCDEVCFKSKNLYNHANYLIRQQLFYLETFLPYDGKEHSLYFQVKNHETYKALPAQTAEGTLEKLEDNWHSFFEAMKKWKIDPSKFLGMPRPPRYKEKNGRFTAFFTNQQCKIKKGYIRFPKTNLHVKTRVAEPLSEVRIVPEGNRYKIEIVHETLWLCARARIQPASSRNCRPSRDDLSIIHGLDGVASLVLLSLVSPKGSMIYARTRSLI